MKPGRIAVLLVLTAGCSSEPPARSADAPEVVIDAPPSATAPAASAPLSRREPPSALAGWTLPAKEGAALGAACVTGTEPVASCGTEGRVSLESQSRKPLRGELPCKLEPIGDDKRFSPNVASGCIDGDYMVLSTICMACRMPDVGSALFVRLSELTPAQHKHLGQVLTLPEEKIPSSPDGWRQVVRKR